MKKKLLTLGAGLLLSAAGITMVAQHEGLRYKAYPDPGTGGAPWTICFGHTGPEVRPGLVVTHKQCELWLHEDLLEAQTYVLQYTKVPLKQGELDAYTSFVFNAGPTNFRNSTMLRLLNQGRRAEACRQFPRWVYANKRKLSGLVARRYEEQAVCLKEGPYVYFP